MRWWRVFIDKISGRSGDLSDAGGPRRRKNTRYDYKVELKAKCSSWPRFVELFARDVSQGGLFIPTDQAAEVGEGVHVDIHLPDGATFRAAGRVVNAVDAATAQAAGKLAGLGIELDELDDAAQARFDEILAAARAEQPIPEEIPITPTGSVRLSAVHQAIADGSLPSVVAEPAKPIEPPTGAAPVVSIKKPSRQGPIVGIDLGTTYTSIAAVQGKKVSILAGADEERSTPSVIAFPKKDEVIVGEQARQRIATDPAHTVVSPKRLVGRAYADREVQTFLGRAPYRSFEGPDGTAVIEMWGRDYAVPQLVSFLLKDTRERAEVLLGKTVDRAVVTVPISFDQSRIASLRRAGEMAQLEIVAVIDEPSAAALANRFDPSFGGTVGVYDFGGGTFDFSVVDVSEGDFQVLATAGDTWLGGDDFDQVIAEAAANQFWREHKVDLRNQAIEWQRLLFACERVKRELSTAESAVLSVPNVLRTAKGMVDLTLTIDRGTFARAASALIGRSLDVCNEALGLLDLKPNDLTTVYLSGGTTYVLAVREALARHFGVPIRTGVPPEHAVCLGAAIHAAQLQFRRAATLASRE